MDFDLIAPHHDPEFGSQRPGLLAGSIDDEPEAYLRLLANPFLGFTYLVAWLVILYQSILGGFAGPLTPTLVAILIPGLGLVPGLMEYHCLDCGRSGRLLRWRKHVCHRSMARRDAGQRRPFRGPTPWVQVLLWVWVVMAGVIALHAMQVLIPSA